MALVAGNRWTFAYIIHISWRYLAAKIEDFKEKRKLIQQIIFFPSLNNIPKLLERLHIVRIG